MSDPLIDAIIKIGNKDNRDNINEILKKEGIDTSNDENYLLDIPELKKLLIGTFKVHEIVDKSRPKPLKIEIIEYIPPNEKLKGEEYLITDPERLVEIDKKDIKVEGLAELISEIYLKYPSKKELSKRVKPMTTEIEHWNGFVIKENGEDLIFEYTDDNLNKFEYTWKEVLQVSKIRSDDYRNFHLWEIGEILGAELESDSSDELKTGERSPVDLKFDNKFIYKYLNQKLQYNAFDQQVNVQYNKEKIEIYFIDTGFQFDHPILNKVINSLSNINHRSSREYKATLLPSYSDIINIFDKIDSEKFDMLYDGNDTQAFLEDFATETLPPNSSNRVSKVKNFWNLFLTSNAIDKKKILRS